MCLNHLAFPNRGWIIELQAHTGTWEGTDSCWGLEGARETRGMDLPCGWGNWSKSQKGNPCSYSLCRLALGATPTSSIAPTCLSKTRMNKRRWKGFESGERCITKSKSQGKEEGAYLYPNLTKAIVGCWKTKWSENYSTAEYRLNFENWGKVIKNTFASPG